MRKVWLSVIAIAKKMVFQMLYFVIVINCNKKSILIGNYSSFLLTWCKSMVTRCTSMVARCKWRMYSREHTCRERGSTSLQLQQLFRSGISLLMGSSLLNKKKDVPAQRRGWIVEEEWIFLSSADLSGVTTWCLCMQGCPFLFTSVSEA